MACSGYSVQSCVAECARTFRPLVSNVLTVPVLEKTMHIRADPQTLAPEIELARPDRPANLDHRRNCCTHNPGIIWRREKWGPDKPADHLLGRSRGGLTAMITCSATRAEHRCVFSSLAVKRFTLATPSHCWTGSAFFQANQVVRARAANGCLPTKATTPKRFAVTAANIEQSFIPMRLY